MELIGASLSRLGASCVCPAASWGRLGRRPGRVLGSLGRVLGEFRAPFRASWSVLAYPGVSWGRLGLGFRSKGEVDCGRSSWMPFSNRYPSDVPPKIDPRSLNKNVEFYGKNSYVLLSRYSKITLLLDVILLPGWLRFRC